MLKRTAGLGVVALGAGAASQPVEADLVTEGKQWNREEETVYEYGGIDTNDVLYGHDLQAEYLGYSPDDENDTLILTFEMFGTGYKRQREHGTTGTWESYASDRTEEIGFTVSSPDSGADVFQFPKQEDESSASSIPKEDAYTTDEALADAAFTIATGGVSSLIARKIAVQGIKKGATNAAVETAASELVNSFVDQKEDNFGGTLSESWTNDDVYDQLTPRQRHTQTHYTKFSVTVPDSYNSVDVRIDSYATLTSSSASEQSVSLDFTVDLQSGGGIV